MLEALREVKDYDTIFFVPHEDENNLVKIQVAHYKDGGEKIDGSVMGDSFDIIIFRMNEEDEITDLDRFDGILIEPREYISRMIKSDWYGMVTRKTTTSHKVADDVFANWTELSYNNS
jgi:hypothetical protein